MILPQTPIHKPQFSDLYFGYSPDDQTYFSMASLFSSHSGCARTFLLTGIGSQLVFVQIGPLTQKIVDGLVSGTDWAVIVQRIGWMLGIGIVDTLVYRICRTTKAYIQSVLRGSLMRQYYTRLLTKDYAFLSTLGTGMIQSKMDKGIDAEIEMYIDVIVAILSIGVRTSILSVIFFRTLPWINAIFVLLGFVVLMTHRFLLPRIKVMQDRLSAITEASTAQTTKIAMEYHTIRLHNKQDYELGLLDKIWSPHPSLAWKTDLVNETAFVVMELGFRGLNALGYFIMGASVLSADISLGTMTMIIMYMDRMRRPISTLMQQMSNRRNNIVRRDRMHAMLDQKNMITDGNSRLLLPIGDLVFDKVGFGYGSVWQSFGVGPDDDDTAPSQSSLHNNAFTTPLFTDFSLTIPQGKMTALVGRSGSGKTTLVKLLLRLYDVHSGQIMIGSQDIRSLVRSERYEHIGYLSQDPGIFDGTVRENLMYGVSSMLDLTRNPSPTRGGTETEDARLWEALELACIADRVRSFASGLDEALGEKGIRLSGGEKQRLAIARLFLRDSSVIILDEPSAALDSESEYLITQSFRKLFAGKTVIVIAHRLQTVMYADQIVVMDKGQIIEMGKHTDLVTKGGVYAGLVDLQHGRIEE